MSGSKDIKLPIRDAYTIKTLFNDLKKLRLTPSTLYVIGSEIIYYEWVKAKESLDADDSFTGLFGELLDFMQNKYEQELIRGDIRRIEDTPSAVLNEFLKDSPIEFRALVLERSGEYIRGVLHAALAQSRRELSQYEKIEEQVRKDLNRKPNDPELWNQLRLALWILGRYDEASVAYKKSKKLGWDPKKSKVVGV